MNVAFLIERIMIGMFFLMAGFNHLRNLSRMGQYAQAKGTPAPQLAVAGAGVVLLLGGTSVLLGAFPTVGIALLILFLLGASFQIHTYWKEKDAQARQADKINFMKNMALVGALLMIPILPQPWPLSLELG